MRIIGQYVNYRRYTEQVRDQHGSLASYKHWQREKGKHERFVLR